MTARPDLSALRIDRTDEETGNRGRIVGWLVAAAVVVGVGIVAWVKWIAPARAPLVETIIAKPSVNVINPPLLTATGYIVANRQAKITPRRSIASCSSL